MHRMPTSERISLWLDRLNRFAKSHLTAADFCRQEQVSLPSFYQWKRRLSPRVDSPKQRRPRRSNRQSQRSTVASVQSNQGFAELVVKPLPTSAQALLPGGITITLGDQPEMAQFIVDRLLHHAVPATGQQGQAKSC